MVAVTQQVITRQRWTDAEAVAAVQDRPLARVAERAGAGGFDPSAMISRAVQTQVIPRLLLARRVRGGGDSESRTLTVSGEHVETLVTLALARELPASEHFVDDLLRQGVSAEELYLHLLTPAARQLGDLWYEDRCDFTQVTTGLWRLQHVLRDLGPAFLRDTRSLAHAPRALFLPVPGEQHTLGLMMVVDFFRRAGWSVRTGTVADRSELVSLVRSQPFAVIGLSVACGERLEDVEAAIRTVRRSTRNGAVGVMVGGPLFVAHPELVMSVGADATAVDGRQAVLQAQTLMTMIADQA